MKNKFLKIFITILTMLTLSQTSFAMKENESYPNNVNEMISKTQEIQTQIDTLREENTTLSTYNKNVRNKYKALIESKDKEKLSDAKEIMQQIRILNTNLKNQYYDNLYNSLQESYNLKTQVLSKLKSKNELLKNLNTLYTELDNKINN